MSKDILKAALLAGTALCATSVMALAEEAKPKVEEIVVTGTRITSPGYQAPTPVTAISADDLNKAAPGDLVNSLRNVPQFLGSSGPTNSITGGTPGGTGGANQQVGPRGNFLNLRDLGTTRVLVMMDGMRMPPTNYTDRVNADFIPQLLVKRVDVVTAGASAAYGSDAVSGAVNFVLDTKFTGTKGDIEGGVSGQGDNGNYRIGLAEGYQANDRVHLLVSLERHQQYGTTWGERPINGNSYVSYNFAGAVPGSKSPPGSAANPFRTYVGAVSSINPNSGLFNTGPFAGMTYNPDGTTRLYDYGIRTGTSSISVGGDGYQVDRSTNFLLAPYRTDQIFLRGDDDLSDTISGYVQATWDDYHELDTGLGSTIAFTPIFSGNPYIPAALQAQLAPNASFLYSQNISPAISTSASPSHYDDRYISVQAGLKGELGKNWNWRFDYVYGNARSHAVTDNILYNKALLASIDAVRAPNGNVVCRVTLTNPGVFPGCIPWDIFGATALANTPAAIFQQNFGNPNYSSLVAHHEAQLQISGEPFALWAGPVSVAAGLEYRSDTLSMNSNSDPAQVIDYTGIRGARASTTPYFLANQAVGNGSVNVKEGFGEVAVPLLKDKPLIDSVDANAAFRVTDYSTSGTVTTWKFGGTYDPSEDIRFRITRSRDIRSPSLYELFGGKQLNVFSYFDPHTGVSGLIQEGGGGNPALQPETGDTLTFGAVLHPRFLPKFNMSIDYYDVKILGAVSTLPLTTIGTDCEAAGGTGPFCALIHRPLPYSNTTAANFPTEVDDFPVNTSLLHAKGVDFEANYTTAAGAGDLNFHFIGSYQYKFLVQVDPSSPVYNYAGYQENGGLPKFRGTLSAEYDYEAWSAYIQERYIDGMKYGPQFSYIEKPIPAVVYTDMTFNYNMKKFGADVNLFLTINNLFDRRPPLVPDYGSGSATPGLTYATLTGIYDLNGRAFTMGTRFKF